MISINDFKVGTTAYMVDFSRRNETLTALPVVKIGRKYVSVALGRCKFDFYCGFSPYALVEKTQYSVNCYLFPTEQAYKDYTELKTLERWLQDAARKYDRYTLNQLRKVRDILEREE